MKRILIIAYYWRGRVPGLAKYLPEFGWQPVILTTPSPLDQQPASELTIIETDRSLVLGFWRKLLGFNPSEDVGKQIKSKFNITFEHPWYRFLSWIYRKGNEIVNYPDAEKGWRPFAVKSGSELLQNENIDAMVSSSSPVTSHLIAKELKAKHKIPWIADLRDLWSQNHNYDYGRLRHFFDTRLELKTLASADALVTVSPIWAEELKRLHRRAAVYSITNGFDPQEVNSPPAKLTDKFTITYTGLIYTGKQDPTKLLVALQDLISKGDIKPEEVEVRFYGHKVEWLPNEIERHGLSAIANYYGIVPQEIAFEKQRESQLLLLLNWEDPQEKGCYPLKVFEYLAAQRPILAVGGFGNDVIESLLDETKAGTYCKTVEDVKDVLCKSYLEYKRKGEVSYHGNIQEIDKYSHREMARKFADILDSACQEK